MIRLYYLMWASELASGFCFFSTLFDISCAFDCSSSLISYLVDSPTSEQNVSKPKESEAPQFTESDI